MIAARAAGVDGVIVAQKVTWFVSLAVKGLDVEGVEQLLLDPVGCVPEDVAQHGYPV